MLREDLAEAAVGALVEAVEVTPKPGLTDRRGPGPAGPADLHTARWAAKALHPGLASMAAAARRAGAVTPQLREELGSIGRATERSARQAACGTTLHRGAVWSLGLLVAAAALRPGATAAETTATAKSLAALRDRRAPRLPSVGSSVAAKYGAAGARGEARAGFPHVRRAWAVLRETGPAGRTDALLAIMGTLQDTGLLHTAGPGGLRLVQAGARAVTEAGGTATAEGRAALSALETEVRTRGWRPGGSEPLLAAALFLYRVA